MRVLCAPRRGVSSIRRTPAAFKRASARFDIVDGHGDVVDAFASLRHEFINRCAGPGGLQKLDAAFADVQHGDANALLVHLIIAADLQTNGVFINLHGFSERLYRDADVIDFHLNLKFRMTSSTTE